MKFKRLETTELNYTVSGYSKVDCNNYLANANSKKLKIHNSLVSKPDIPIADKVLKAKRA